MFKRFALALVILAFAAGTAMAAPLTAKVATVDTKSVVVTLDADKAPAWVKKGAAIKIKGLGAAKITEVSGKSVTISTSKASDDEGGRRHLVRQGRLGRVLSGPSVKVHRVRPGLPRPARPAAAGRRVSLRCPCFSPASAWPSSVGLAACTGKCPNERGVPGLPSRPRSRLSNATPVACPATAAIPTRDRAIGRHAGHLRRRRRVVA